MVMEDLQASLSVLGLAISTTPEKGRCLVTTKDFLPGEVIISQDPYVSVPNNAPDSRCDRCLGSSNLKKCSACQVAWYCESTCQRSEWKLHRLECQALRRLDKERRKLLTPTLRMMVRLYFRKKLQNEKVIPITVTDNYNLVEALVDHISDIDEQQFVLYAQMANLVNMVLQWPDINIKEIARNFSRFACNAHTICDFELRPLATGLYPVVSFINHSCLPNSVLVFEGKLAVVRAITPIPKGTEVSISYIETAGSTETRQKNLREKYLFTCTCPLCSKVDLREDIEESAILEGYRCKNDKCSGSLFRDSDDKSFVCQRCGLSRNKEEIQAIASEVKLLQDEASIFLSAGKLDNLEVTAIYKKIELLQLKLCHPFSIDLMRTRESLLKVLMELKDWRGALTYCRLTIPVYERVYPMIHPLLGLQYYSCGKLEWLLGNTEEAIKSLTKAADILRITHGTHTSFMKDLLVMLEEARAEAAYALS